MAEAAGWEDELLSGVDPLERWPAVKILRAASSNNPAFVETFTQVSGTAEKVGTWNLRVKYTRVLMWECVPL